MQLVCKQCNAVYSIASQKLPACKAAVHCKRCGYKMVIQRESSMAAPSDASCRAAAGPPLTTGHNKEILSAFPGLADNAHYNLRDIFQPDKKGRFKHKANQLKAKILMAVQPTLNRILRPNEIVLRVAVGTAFHPFELLLGNGVFTMLYNRYAIVASDQRLVMINVNQRLTKLRHYFFQMPYDEIKKISRGVFRTSLTLTPKKGRRRVFTSMKAALTAELADCITPRLDARKAIATSAMLPNLCPSCFCPLGGRLVQCPSCHTGFKRPLSAALLSFVLPGLGDLYLGHHALGCLEMIGSAFIWLLALGFLLSGGPEGIGMALILVLFYNGMDALFTFHMGAKGYVAAKKPPLQAHPGLAASRAC